jgi:hypothetical protein
MISRGRSDERPFFAGQFYSLNYWQPEYILLNHPKANILTG